MQLVRFLAVGVLNSALGLVLIYGAMALHVDYRIANAMGYTGGILFSFAVNRTWTFADQGHWRTSFINWLVVVGAAYGVQFCFVVGLHLGLGIPAAVAQFLGLPVYALLSFLGARSVVFSSRTTS